MLWGVFGLVILSMLILDLGVFNRKAHVIRLKEAALWSSVWIAVALAFGGFVAYRLGSEKALEFVTGYVIEESLSVDNLFVFLVIFSYFRVPRENEHKVLFWGILGVLVTRGVFVTMGVVLIRQFHWILYVFGGILIVTAVKLAIEKDEEVHPEKNPVLKLFRKIMPVTEQYEGGKFFVRHNGWIMATPLLVVLIAIESTDIIFAVDSVPAVLGITHDPFIVYTSNIFAIMGLRSLFFLLAGLMGLFHYLHYGLALILGFVGVKMLVADLYQIPVGVALSVVAGILVISVVASLVWPEKSKA